MSQKTQANSPRTIHPRASYSYIQLLDYKARLHLFIYFNLWKWQLSLVLKNTHFSYYKKKKKKVCFLDLYSDKSWKEVAQ